MREVCASEVAHIHALKRDIEEIVSIWGLLIGASQELLDEGPSCESIFKRASDAQDHLIHVVID